jgi:SHAQKYF class myb-like DNA-binding protein
MSQTKVLSQSQNNMPIMIDVRENSIVSNSLSNENEQTPFYSYSTSSHELFNEFGNPSIQGRWTQKEHLIFLAWIIHFGRDWKKIEYHVQTRSSAQARSHAQKVLKKMDRNAIMREIKQLKIKLKFDPIEYKCENLSVLTIEGDNWRDIPGLVISRARRVKKNGGNKRDINATTKVEWLILKDAQM